MKVAKARVALHMAMGDMKDATTEGAPKVYRKLWRNRPGAMSIALHGSVRESRCEEHCDRVAC